MTAAVRQSSATSRGNRVLVCSNQDLPFDFIACAPARYTSYGIPRYKFPILQYPQRTTEIVNAWEYKRRIETIICSAPSDRKWNIRPILTQEKGVSPRRPAAQKISGGLTKERIIRDFGGS